MSRTITISILFLCLLSLSAVSMAQQPTQTSIQNDHAQLALFTSVINNPTLINEPTRIHVNGRDLEVPPHWSFTAAPQVGGLPPYIRRYDQPGYQFIWEWVNGEAGFAQDGIQLYGNQRYAVRVNYQTDLYYTSGDLPFVPYDFRIYARLYTAQGGMQTLPHFNMSGLTDTHSIEWVIESTVNPYPFVRLEVLFDVEWPIFRGTATMQSIDIVTVAPDYRPDFVIPFE